MGRLLVVEDEPHIASGLRFNLEAEGHSVDVVETGEAALTAVDANASAFDCIVLDVMLPGMDGQTHPPSRSRQTDQRHSGASGAAHRCAGGNPLSDVVDRSALTAASGRRA